MARKFVQIDDVTGKQKRVAALYTDDFFTGDGSTVNFTLTNGTITASNLVDALQNGVLVEEGGGADYTRNAGANRLTWSVAPPNNARIRIRVWS